MKISRILLFILGVLLGLTAICCLMPEGGLALGGVKLEFPSLLQVFDAGDDEEVRDSVEMLSPEELLEQRMASLQTQKADEFHQFASTSPQRIYLPGDDETYLDPFFEALEAADSQHVRILHLGDSQLECDRISSSLRQHYQETFGGHGVGLVPALQTVPTYTLSQTISPSESIGHHLVYGPAEARASHRRYGVMGQVNHVHAGTTMRFTARDLEKYPCTGGVRRLTVMAGGSGGMTLNANGQSISLNAVGGNESCSILRADIPQGTNTLTLTSHGEYDVYGIMLDGVKGVSLDNVPMRGCSGTIFTQIDEQTLQPYFQTDDVRLLILQYGGNSVPSVSGAKGISSYMKTLRRQIALFRRLAPKASILFIGPADMATRIGGEMKTYPVLPEVVDSLREMSLQEGIAFWDMYAAMGGRGSIVKWYRAKPQLAGADFVHFTPKGAQKMADMLYGTIQLYYRYYRLRMGKESESDMKDMEFKDAVAPVEGSGTISVSELPPRPAPGEDGVEDGLDYEDGLPTDEHPLEGESPAEGKHEEMSHPAEVQEANVQVVEESAP